MKNSLNAALAGLLMALAGLAATSAWAEPQGIDLSAPGVLKQREVVASPASLDGRPALSVTFADGTKGGDRPTFVWLDAVDFHNGTITLQIAGSRRADAPAWARGFVGVAFRINEDASKFEAIYLRPANGQAEDAERRQHAVQYFSYPDYDFFRLRNEAPGIYESAADIDLDQWATIKISVEGTTASLFVNDSSEPALIVKDLKLGADAHGGIGLWVDTGTVGYFSDLVIEKK